MADPDILDEPSRLPRRGGRHSRSTLTSQIVIRLNDFPQFAFRGAVAAIGVGVMALDQLFKPALDLLFGGLRFEPERIQCLALGIAHHTRLWRAPLKFRLLGCCLKSPKHAERIIGAFRAQSGGVRAPARPAAIHPHFPGWAMPYDCVLLVPGDVVGSHTGKEIVGMIVLADVIEAELPVF